MFAVCLNKVIVKGETLTDVNLNIRSNSQKGLTKNGEAFLFRGINESAAEICPEILIIIYLYQTQFN